MLPSVHAMAVATADPDLFTHLMGRAGLRIVRRDNDPMSEHVQEEAVSAIASAITEDAQYGVALDPYRSKLRTIAERAGYLVEFAVPEEDPEMMGGEPPMGGEEMGDGPPMGDEEMGGGPPMGGEDPDAGLHGEMPMGGEIEISVGDDSIPPMEEENPELMQLAQVPLGMELANEIMAVIQGKGVGGIEDEEMMPGDDMGMEGPPEEEMGMEEGPPEEEPPQEEGPPEEEHESKGEVPEEFENE